MSRGSPKAEQVATDELVNRNECGAEVRTFAGLERGDRPPKRTVLITWLALFFGVATVGTVISALITGSASASNAPTQAQVVAALQITEINWHKGGFNNVMMLNAAVQNTGESDVKDIQVVCDHPSAGATKSTATLPRSMDRSRLASGS
jgi:hypothetical protein